jgi:flagellin
MTVINTNIAASITANAMKSNQRAMETTMERLSTGMRINSAADDAAGLAIGSKMESQIRGLSQAIRNANDGISMIQTADGAAIEIGDMLQRMRELAVQAANGTNSTAEKANLNKEFSALATEIDRVANDTTFNNQNVMNGSVGTVNFTVGADQADVSSVVFGDFNMTDGATSGTAATFDLDITQAQLRAIGASNSLVLSTSTGQTLTITEANIEATNAAAGFSDATLADLVTAITSAQTNGNAQVSNENFGFTAALNPGDNTAGIRLTQTVAGSGGSVTGALQATAGGIHSAITGASLEQNSAYGSGTGVMGANISDFLTAGNNEAEVTTTIAELDVAIAGVASARADFGAAINSLEYSVDSLQGAVQNTMSAKSAIMDADYAAETTELARTQIIAQAATAMLSQANQQQQSVLALLK